MVDERNQTNFIKISNMIQDVLKALGISEENNGVSTGLAWQAGKGKRIASVSPVDGKLIAHVNMADRAGYEHAVQSAQEAFKSWRLMPAPKRGEIVRQIGDALRLQKEPLGKLVS